MSVNPLYGWNLSSGWPFENSQFACFEIVNLSLHKEELVSREPVVS